MRKQLDRVVNASLVSRPMMTAIPTPPAPPFYLVSGLRGDGTPYKCFRTLHVMRGDKMVGAVQCVGPCYGITAVPGHRHGPWIAFVGANPDDAKNTAGRHDTEEAAAFAVLAELDA